jgi:hypothetical protein
MDTYYYEAMTTHEQFAFYSDFAYRFFAYAHKKISRRIDCILEVDYCDNINFTFANMRRPNKIFLHIDNIIHEFGNGYDKNNICSLICDALVHELHHVEQVLSQQTYRQDPMYMKAIEEAVAKESTMWLYAHKQEIDKLFKMDLNMNLPYINIPNAENNMYRACDDAESIYKYTIRNVIFRNDDAYIEFESAILNAYDNVSITVKDKQNFLIKSNGQFVGGASLSTFVNMVGGYFGNYDRYTVNVNVITNPYRDEVVAVATFTLSNRKRFPMAFNED